jgi:hypothetical protein
VDDIIALEDAKTVMFPAPNQLAAKCSGGGKFKTTVNPGQTFAAEFQLEANTIIAWEFVTTNGKDVSFSVLEGSTVLLPNTRYDAHKATVSGKAGPFKSDVSIILRWDNTYSYLSGKDLEYSISFLDHSGAKHPSDVPVGGAPLAVDSAAQIVSPRPQSRLGIGAVLQRTGARLLRERHATYGAVLRVQAVSVVLPFVTRHMSHVYSALHTDTPVQLHINGPAYTSHAIDIGDMIIEIDGAVVPVASLQCGLVHFLTVITGVRVALMDDQYLDCKDPIGEDGVLLRSYCIRHLHFRSLPSCRL